MVNRLDTSVSPDKSGKLVMTVTANFTAEPVGDTLRFWIDRLKLPAAELEFSGYNQVFQELMAPGSLLASNQPGVNFLLIRLEDWARNQKLAQQADAISAATHEFLNTLKAFSQRARRPTVLLLCPPSREARANSQLSVALAQLGEEFRTTIGALRGITLVSAEEVAELYPVDVIDDPENNRQAHIPFTPEYWTAVGTMLARKARTFLSQPYKVIAVDADNTLWGGVVGEAGAAGVRADEEWRTLQERLRQLKAQGMLLVLVSKNEESDVAEVFRRKDMTLRREDFVAWKVNWNRKSENLASLAKELELGLDSFIFLDDNPVECAEVAGHLPQVTTLLLPADAKQIPDFLRHVWAFDLRAATAVDEKRTELYQQQSQRNQLRSTATTFREFIDSLQLHVSVEPPVARDYERAAQLTQRTNQFNTSGIRRTTPELSALLESGQRGALLVRARDRFGDYGDIGLAVFSVAQTNLVVDTLLFSCRVLGKGVEHRFLASLGAEAKRLGTSNVVFPFKRTERNQPAENFLKSIGAQLRDDSAFHLATSAAAAVAFDPDNVAQQVTDSPEKTETFSNAPEKTDFSEIASGLRSIAAIAQAVARHYLRARPALAGPAVPAGNSNEARLVKIWEDVLHVYPVGVTDKFLNLGGQSLQAAAIASRIAGEFGARLPFTALLNNPDITELNKQISEAPVAGSVEALPAATKLSLSPAQQRIWFLDQFIPNRAAYNIPLARRIGGPLNLEALEAALDLVTLRHETLRSSFASSDGQPGIQVASQLKISATRLAAASEDEAIALANEEAHQPFDLSHGPLLRCLAITMGPDDHLLVLNVHHIVSDGWSTGILWRDLSEGYAAILEGRLPSWTPLATSYADYSSWQQGRLSSGDFQSDLSYWKEELRGAPALLELPTDKLRPSAMTYAGNAVYEQISAAGRHAVESLAQREGCTPFMVLLAAFQTLLYRYSQQRDIVVGAPVAGRSHASLDNLVGCFINTLAIRTQLDEEATFRGHLQTVRAKVLEALAHQDLPFELLVNELGLARNLSHAPLFQVMLVLQNTLNTDFASAGLKVASVPVHNGGAKFDLVLEITPGADGYSLALEFNTSLFLPQTAQRLLQHFARLLEQGSSSPDTSLASLSMMAEAEVQQMLTFMNTAEASFENLECLHKWFQRNAESTPDAPALTFESQTLSYAELNRRANRVAHQLIGCGVGPDVLVGICVDRSLNLVIAILGVLKAGGAYLPIDLSYPAERLAFMLEDANAPVLLTEKKLVAALPKHGGRTICLDDEAAGLAAQPETNPVTAVTPEHMAYVIYTSGSTGKPKGCMVTHRNVSRLMRATEKWYGFNKSDVWTMFHSSAFDFSVWEIWGALLYGGRLVVVPFLVSRSPEAFYELLAAEQVTVLNQTPSAFRQLMQVEESVGQKKLALRYVIFGGEALDMQSLRPWFERHGDRQPLLVNMYGITETTVHVTYRPLSKDDLNSGSVIGKPIPDLKIYVLDAHRQPIPVGVPGEMYVGGAGLARGYLRRPELTEQRFISDHLTGRPGSRLYKTGDLARFLPGHDIEYLGRIDDQVKIRGFRIELGEIESVLSQHPAVRQVVVLAREDEPSNKRLVGYLVATSPAPEVSVLREHLKKQLPDYMVPAAFVFLDKLPLTNNGKVDRKALPAPEQHRPELAGRYLAPRTPAEEKLAAIWSKALRVERVGVNDNFFELGGDSILSIQIISAARREGLQLTPALLFAHQTVAELAAVAIAISGASEKSAAQGMVAGSLPLTPIQKWFFEQRLDDSQHYNQAFLFEVPERMERALLEGALAEVSRQHDALRLRFVQSANGWSQSYSEADEVAPLTWTDLSSVGEAERRATLEAAAAKAEASLNLQNGPLWRAVYFDLGKNQPGKLLVAVHHLAIDGISWGPLLEDLESAYRQLKAGQRVELPAKTSSYKAWAERLTEYSASETLRLELPYWKAVTEPRQTSDALKPLEISGTPADNTEGAATTLKLSLTVEETRALLQNVPAAYNTQINDVLLAALLRASHKWSGSPALFTNLEGHGRENIIEDLDLSRTAGWFTSIFPVRLELPNAGAHWQPSETLKSVKEQLRKIPQRGIGYGILRYLTSGDELSAAAEPAMVFNYLGQFDQILAGSTLFRFAEESTGPWHSPKQKRRQALETNCVVLNGRLELRWTYNQKLHSGKDVTQLADNFTATLKELIAHCQAPGAGGRTPSDFPLARLEQPAIDNFFKQHGDIEDIYPLSPIQTLFYSANPGNALLAFDQWRCTLRGELNVAAFQRAWQETLRRHSILRSTIHGEGLREPVQVVHRDAKPPWTIEDWSSVPAEERESRWAEFLRLDRTRPLMLTEAPAMRFALIRWDKQTWEFLWSVPALLLDGWSWPLVFRDSSRLYQSFAKDLPIEMEHARPYRDYLGWLGKQTPGEAQNFWRENLAGFKEPTPLQRDSTEPVTTGERYVEADLKISSEANNALKTAARQLQLTLSSLVQGAWALLLSRQSGNADVVFGAAFAGRPADLHGVESIVGPFVNNLPVRVTVDRGATAGEFFRELHARMLKLSPVQYTPLMEIQQYSEMPWRHRMFDSLVVFQNYLVDESAKTFGDAVQIADFTGPVHTNYPVMLLAEPGTSLQLKLIYDRRALAPATVQRWIRDLETILELAPVFFEKRVADLLALLSAPLPAPAEGSSKRKFRAQSQNFVPPQTEMEIAIASVWQNMFGLERISVEENFFDLGGHSMLLIQMHGRLRELLKTEFSIVTLLEHPSIGSLARHLQQAAAPAANGEKWQDRAARQKEALAKMRSTLKK
jgi:amino acid adenylation domain-containing protein/FkbH-like protein/non-ribosomal peptide synthase protein (TIGR01720 family)